MSVLFTEGFDAYGTSPSAANLDTYISRKWPTYFDPGPAFSLAAGRFSGRAFEVHQNRWIVSPNLGNNVDTLVGVAINPQNMSAFDANQILVSLYEGSNLGLNVRLTVTGELEVRKGSTLLATSSGAGISLSTWHTIEFHVHAHASTGTWELRFNGVTILSASGANTVASSNAYYNFVRLGPTGSVSAYCLYDDVYIRDDSTFLGSWKISTIFPNGDAGPNDGTPSTGSDNYAVVDEAEPNGDTDYISDAAGDSELFDYSSVVASTVYCVQVNTIARIDDATPRDIALAAKSGSTTDASTPQTVGSSYDWFGAVWELNPDTGMPWTASEINAAQFGFEVS